MNQKKTLKILTAGILLFLLVALVFTGGAAASGKIYVNTDEAQYDSELSGYVVPVYVDVTGNLPLFGFSAIVSVGETTGGTIEFVKNSMNKINYDKDYATNGAINAINLNLTGTKNLIFKLLVKPESSTTTSVVIPDGYLDCVIEENDTPDGYDATKEYEFKGGILNIGGTTVTVTFNSQGGSEVASQTFAAGGKATEPSPAPTKEHCTFGGWYKEAGCTTAWNFNTAVTANMTLYAKWNAITSYTVTFNPNGGTVTPTSKQVIKNQAYGQLPTPTRDGYTFSGWFTEQTGGSQVTATTTVTATSDHTLYAHWSGTAVTVIYKPDASSTQTYKKTVAKGSSHTLLTADACGFTAPEGKMFDYWLIGTEHKSAGDSITVNEDTTVIANWKDIPPTTVTVTFDSQGGSAVASQTFTAGEKATEPSPAPTKDHYTFGGWYKEPGCTNAWNFDTVVTGNMKLYAKWNAIYHTVTFEANGGTVTPTSKQVAENQMYGQLPTPTRDGYTFNGWFTEETGGSQVTATTTVTATKDHKLYAHWTAHTYTVKFHENGGSGTMSDQSFTYDVAQKLTTNAFIAPTGKQFEGWAESETGSTKYTDGQSVSNLTKTDKGVVNLYAVWSEKPKEYWTISFEKGDTGASGEMGSVTVEKGQSWEVCSCGFTAPSGKQFDKWQIKGTSTYLSPKESYTPTENTTLVAQWKDLEYWTLTFKPNGGEGSEWEESIVKGTSTRLPANMFTAPANMHFDGWLINGTKYAAYSLYTPTADTNVLATWAQNGGGGGGGGGSSTPSTPETPDVVYEITVDVNGDSSVEVPTYDEDGNLVFQPVTDVDMTGDAYGQVYIGNITDEVNAENIKAVAKLETVVNENTPSISLADFRVTTISEAISAGIPVSNGYIGGNGHAPILIEVQNTSGATGVQFWSVVEVKPAVSGGTINQVHFRVPLASLEEAGYTTKDVVMYHGITNNGQRTWYPLVTSLESTDDTFAYYSAETEGASPFGILFLKDTTKVDGQSSTPSSSDKTSSDKTTKSPVPVLGILAGLGAAGVLMKRRH